MVNCSRYVNVWGLFLAGDWGVNSSRIGSKTDPSHWNDERRNTGFFGVLSPADEERSVDEDECQEEGDGGH